MAGTKEWLKEICIPVYILIAIFNLASWIDLSAVWVELPLLVNRLPEGWELPSYLMVVSQVAHLGTFGYVILKKFMKDRIQEWPFIYAVTLLGALFLFMMAFMWDRTAVIGGREVGIGIISLTAALALVDSMSVVIFLPYISRFKPQYITAFFMGEGMCQLIPSLISLLQGVGEDPICLNVTQINYNQTGNFSYTTFLIYPEYPDPRFSVQAFLLFMFGIMLCSSLAFTLLHFLPYCKKEHASTQDTADRKEEAFLDNGDVVNDPNLEDKKDIAQLTEFATNEKQTDAEKEDTGSGRQPMPKWEFWYCQIYVFLGVLLMYGLVPGIQPFSTLPYGSRAYNLSLRLGLTMAPITSFFALFVPTRSKTVLSIVFAVGSGVSAYQVYLAFMSPYPPLKGTVEGEVIVVSVLLDQSYPSQKLLYFLS